MGELNYRGIHFDEVSKKQTLIKVLQLTAVNAIFQNIYEIHELRRFFVKRIKIILFIGK